MRLSTRSLSLSTALVAVVAAGAQATAAGQAAALPFAASGAFGRLDVTGAGRTVDFDTTTGRYAVDGVVRNTRPVTVTLPETVALRAGQRTIHAFDFTSVRIGRGTRVTARGADPLVILSRGAADIAAPLVLDGAAGRAGGKGAGGGGGGGGGAVAILAAGPLTVTGAVSVRGGAGGAGDGASVPGDPAYDGGAGGGGAVLLGSARRVLLDAPVFTASGDGAATGPVSLVGRIDLGTYASVNGLAPDAAGVRRLPALAHAAFDLAGGGGGGGGGGSGLPVGDDTRGYVRHGAAGGTPGVGGGAGGGSGYAVAGGSGGSGGAGSGLGSGGGGGGGGGAFAGPGGTGGGGAGSGAAGGPGGAGGAGNCSSGATGGSGGSGGNGSVSGGSGGSGGGGGNSGGESGDDGSDGNGVGAGGGGAGGGGDACGTSGSGAGGSGGAGAVGGGPGSSGTAGNARAPKASADVIVVPGDGAVCHLLSATYVATSATPNLWTGKLAAGPMYKGAADGMTNTLTCRVQRNHDDYGTPNGPAVVAQETSDGVLVSPGEAITYEAGPLDLVYLCATFDAPDPLYWDSATGTWSLSPTATCQPLTALL